jgi:hypothetical protein
MSNSLDIDIPLLSIYQKQEIVKGYRKPAKL